MMMFNVYLVKDTERAKAFLAVAYYPVPRETADCDYDDSYYVKLTDHLTWIFCFRSAFFGAILQAVAVVPFYYYRPDHTARESLSLSLFKKHRSLHRKILY